jgi:hypothetical protein
VTTDQPTQLDRIEAKLDRALETRVEPETCNNRYAVRSGGTIVNYVDCPQPRPCLIHDRPRGHTLRDQFNDLIELHGNGHISDDRFYDQINIITGIPFPGLARHADYLMTKYRDGLMSVDELRARIEEISGVRFPDAAD